MITLRGATLPICRLERLLRLERAPSDLGPRRRYVVVVSLGNRRSGWSSITCSASKTS